MRFKIKSIALKLWLVMMALVIIVLLVLWFFQIVFLEQFYTQMRINDIKKAGSDVVKLLDKGTQWEFQDKLDELAYNNNLTAELIDTHYNTLYSSGTPSMVGQMPMMRNNLKKEALSKVFSGNIISVSTTHPRFGSTFILIGIPVIIKEQIQGALFIDLPLVPVKDTVNILKKQLFYITIILLIVAMSGSFLLSRTFTRPILDIIKVSMEMSAGNFSARIKVKQKDEIGRLGETINHMGEELSKIDKLRKDLIANISHELRTPLSLIKGYAETIKDISGNLPEKREKHLDIIIDEANRLSSLVEEILEFSQMQAGYLNLNIKEFELNATLERVYKKFEILSEKTGVEFTLNTRNEVLVYADESKIEQVLYNLLNNALNHTQGGGSIILSLVENQNKVRQNKVRIEVTDTGEGIPENEIPYIWDRFYKADKSGNRKKSRTGLGLAIVKSILIAHDNNYGVESKEGLGTTFWFEVNKKI